MATPSLERTQRELWPDSPGNCTEGHVGPFSLTSHVPRYYTCSACGNEVKSTDALAHSVFMDPTIDPFDICGGGTGRPERVHVPEQKFTAMEWFAIALVGAICLLCLWAGHQ